MHSGTLLNITKQDGLLQMTNVTPTHSWRNIPGYDMFHVFGWKALHGMLAIIIAVATIGTVAIGPCKIGVILIIHSNAVLPLRKAEGVG